MTHPVGTISAASPDMNATATQALTDSIAALGQLVPILVCQGEIIDGRKRMAACRALGLVPRFQEIAEQDDPAAHAIALNLLRTHYSASQRAAYASTVATLRRGDVGRRFGEIPQLADLVHGLTEREAGKQFGVHSTAVNKAKQVRRDGAPEVIAAVEHGHLTLHAAKQLVASVPVGEQPAAVRLLTAGRPRSKRVSVGRVLGLTGGGIRKPPAHKGAIEDVIDRAIRQGESAAGTLQLYEGDLHPNAQQRTDWSATLRSIGRIHRRFLAIITAEQEQTA